MLQKLGSGCVSRPVSCSVASAIIALDRATETDLRMKLSPETLIPCAWAAGGLAGGERRAGGAGGLRGIRVGERAGRGRPSDVPHERARAVRQPFAHQSFAHQLD